MKKNVIKKLYSKYSETVQQYMFNTYSFLEEKFGEISPSWQLSLDMLASNLDMFTRAEEQIQKDGLMIENRFGILEKHPLIKIMNDAQIQIVKLLNEYGLTVKSFTKLRVEEDNDDDFLANIMGDE